MKVILFANTDWYLYNFRRDLALALRQRGDDVVLLSPPGEYASRLQEMGFRWEEIPLSRRGMNPFGEAGTIWHLVQFYRKEKPDIVHHFTVKCVLYGSTAARLAQVNGIVNSITGLGYIFLPGGLLKSMLRLFVRGWYRLVMGKTQVIFENSEDRASFIRYGFIRPENGHLIPGVGVDTHRFIPAPEPEGRPVVLLASRMLWDKGVGEFVEAARLLRAERLPARFALAGRTDPGNPASISDTQLHAWSEEGVVEWWSWGEDMAKILTTIGIICLPSYREGLPTVLIEASACGRAVIAADVPGCRDAIRNGETGLLVTPKDLVSLANGIRKLVLDAELRGKMGAAGRVLVEEKFSAEKIIEQIFSVYQLVAQVSIR